MLWAMIDHEMAMAATLTQQLAALGVHLPGWPSEDRPSDDDWIGRGLLYAEGVRLWRGKLVNATSSTKQVVDHLMSYLWGNSELTPWDQWLILALHPDVQLGFSHDRWLTCIDALKSQPLLPDQLLGGALALAEVQQLAGATVGIKRLFDDFHCDPLQCLKICSYLISSAQTNWRMSEGEVAGEAWQAALALHAEWASLLRRACEYLHDPTLQRDQCAQELSVIMDRALIALGDQDEWALIPYARVRKLLLGRDIEPALELLRAALPDRLHASHRNAHARSLASQILARAGSWREAEEMHRHAVEAMACSAEDDVALKAEIHILRTQSELLSHELSLALHSGSLASPAPAGPTRASDVAATADMGTRYASFSRSQLGQDLWVLEKLNWKKNGYFVEFGATDGVLLSNTWMLEMCFGWDGICAEPNPRFFSALQKNRSCQLSSACVYSETGVSREFVLADAYGGLAEFSGRDLHADKREAYALTGNTMQVTTVSLVDLLEAHGAPATIDYLSVDTEGSELVILEAFDWNRYQVRCITVEHNNTDCRDKIYALLSGQGYTRQSAKFDDWYFKDFGE